MPAHFAKDVDDAITSRQSVRRFTDEPGSREQVHHRLDVARYAPSGTNHQPWHVHVLSGAPRDALCAEIVADYQANGERSEREYDYYPTE